MRRMDSNQWRRKEQSGNICVVVGEVPRSMSVTCYGSSHACLLLRTWYIIIVNRRGAGIAATPGEANGLRSVATRETG